jgi:hypothetical protein
LIDEQFNGADPLRRDSTNRASQRIGDFSSTEFNASHPHSFGNKPIARGVFPKWFLALLER